MQPSRWFSTKSASRSRSSCLWILRWPLTMSQPRLGTRVSVPLCALSGGGAARLQADGGTQRRSAGRSWVRRDSWIGLRRGSYRLFLEVRDFAGAIAPLAHPPPVRCAGQPCRNRRRIVCTEPAPKRAAPMPALAGTGAANSHAALFPQLARYDTIGSGRQVRSRSLV